MAEVVVTGATGFTGSHLCRRLVRDGHSVAALVRATSRTAGLEQLGVRCRVADLGQPAGLRAAIDGASVVYHVAAAYRVEHADRDEFRRVNVEATRNLLQAAAEQGVERFVHCSTVGVQGQIDDPPANEEYRFQPGDHYQESKLAGEKEALLFAARGLPVSVVRPVGIYGPGDSRFLKLFRAIARGRFVMIGSGRTLYHMTYVEDLVRGIVLCGTSPAAPGQVFTIAGPEYTTLDELVGFVAAELGCRKPRMRVPLAPVLAAAAACEAVCRPLGINPPLYPRRVEFFAKDRAFDISKARRLLGYEPQVALREGIARTARWYREQGWL
ncbi:MAG: NAD-dependent epimerase/dehydratase family protein [Acidobacteria bacterium]|nr:NAD-dependent epimerase/dehydratase family protein [Acidobacteriota bacterium]